jgi:predicted porin
MNKKFLASLIGAMLVSSVVLAAPVISLDQGETVFGINHSDLDGDDVDGFFIENAISQKFTVGLQYKEGDFGGHETDFYAKRKLPQNVNLLLGMRDYSGAGNKLMLGAEVSTSLADKVTGYAGLKFTNLETELNIGATYALTNQLSFDVNYLNKDYDFGKADGLGFGLNYKF